MSRITEFGRPTTASRITPTSPCLLLLLLLLLLSALQLFVSFGLLNYSFPLFPVMCLLFPIIHSQLPQIIPHIVLPFYSWSSLQSCCIRFSFVYGLGHSFIGHSFYMPHKLSRLYFVYLTIFSLLIAFSSSSFVLSLHSPLAFCVGPNILLNIFLSNTNNFC